jgi:hypothetical protein
MAILNNIKQIPFKDDKVIDVQFAIGHGMASIFFASGKVLDVHINDDGSYSRKDYYEDVKRNNRNIIIKNILED